MHTALSFSFNAPPAPGAIHGVFPPQLFPYNLRKCFGLFLLVAIVPIIAELGVCVCASFTDGSSLRRLLQGSLSTSCKGSSWKASPLTECTFPRSSPDNMWSNITFFSHCLINYWLSFRWAPLALGSNLQIRIQTSPPLAIMRFRCFHLATIEVDEVAAI